jgi:HK97 family phage major capsid protein
MDATLKQISNDLHNTLAEITKINAAQKAYEEKNNKEFADFKESNAKAIKDFDAKLIKGEKIQKDLENAIVALGQFQNTTDCTKELKSYNKLLKAFRRPQLSKQNFEEVKEIWDKYVRFDGATLTEGEKKALNTVIDPQGGFFVLPQYSADVEKQAIELHGILGIVKRTNTSTSPYRTNVRWFQFGDSYYKNELTPTPTPTTPEIWKQVSIPVTTQLYGMPFTRESLEDPYTNLQTDIIEGMREGMDDKTGTAVILGTGVDQPRGILTYPDGTDFAEIQRITSSESGGVITWNDVMVRLPKSVKPIYRNSTVSAYVMEKGTFYDLLGDKDGSERFQVANQINFFSGQGISLSILGSPVVWEPAMPAVASDSLPVAFGDFKKAYTFVERIGTSLHRDESDPANITLTLRRRNGGGVVNSEAIKILKIQT